MRLSDLVESGAWLEVEKFKVGNKIDFKGYTFPFVSRMES